MDRPVVIMNTRQEKIVSQSKSQTGRVNSTMSRRYHYSFSSIPFPSSPSSIPFCIAVILPYKGCIVCKGN